MEELAGGLHVGIVTAGHLGGEGVEDVGEEEGGGGEGGKKEDKEEEEEEVEKVVEEEEEEERDEYVARG